MNLAVLVQVQAGDDALAFAQVALGMQVFQAQGRNALLLKPLNILRSSFVGAVHHLHGQAIAHLGFHRSLDRIAKLQIRADQHQPTIGVADQIFYGIGNAVVL